MKKYFLLITLFALVFLGLGNNYSFAETCQNGTTCNAPLTCDCEQDPFDPTAWLCNACKSPCVAGEILVDNGAGGQECCNAQCQALRASMPGLISCSSPVGGKINSFGACTCPTGTKNVNGTCKSCSDPNVCCGISLNTSIPFIGKCIEDNTGSVGGDETGVTGLKAFPVLMGSLTKILVTIILIVSFVLIVIGGIMIATGNPKGGKDMIIKVATGIALLGASGVILRLINPNFFG